MELLVVLSGFCWPGLAMIVMLVQFVIIYRLRRRVQELEEVEYYQYQQPLSQHPPQYQRPLRRRR